MSLLICVGQRSHIIPISRSFSSQKIFDAAQDMVKTQLYTRCSCFSLFDMTPKLCCTTCIYRKFGYVDFASEADMQKALELNGKKVLGQEMKLDMPRTKDGAQEGKKGACIRHFL